MASGSIKSAMTGAYGLRIDWESVPDIEANTSELTMKVYVLYPSINITARSGCYTTIAGNKVEFSTKAIKDEDPGETLIKTRTKTIQHDPDGKKSIKLVAYFPIYLKSTTLGWIYEKKASGTAVLDDIPRNSQIVSQTESVAVDGKNKWAVVLNRNKDTFWHKATLSIGSYKYTSPAFETSHEYAIPTQWLNAMPDTPQGTVAVSIQTYSDKACTTAMGGPVESTFTIVAPASAGPVIDNGWASIAPYNTGAAEGMTVYVQGFSKAEVTFDSAKVSGRYGATIKSVSVTWGGATTSKSPYRTNVLSKSGKQIIKCTATDSRGLKTTQSIEVNVEAYTPPALSGIHIFRCDASGAEDDMGAYVSFKATVTYASCGKENTISMKAGYKPVSGNAWTEANLQSSTEIVTGGGLNAASSYNARIRATDRLGSTAEFATLISTAEAAFNIKRGGKGAAFGKYAEHNDALDIDEWDLIANGVLIGGTVYMTAGTENPANRFGGTWTQANASGIPLNIWTKT